jgi:hypothetical protein
MVVEVNELVQRFAGVVRATNVASVSKYIVGVSEKVQFGGDRTAFYSIYEDSILAKIFVFRSLPSCLNISLIANSADEAGPKTLATHHMCFPRVNWGHKQCSVCVCHFLSFG